MDPLGLQPSKNKLKGNIIDGIIELVGQDNNIYKNAKLKKILFIIIINQV